MGKSKKNKTTFRPMDQKSDTNLKPEQSCSRQINKTDVKTSSATTQDVNTLGKAQIHSNSIDNDCGKVVTPSTDEVEKPLSLLEGKKFVPRNKGCSKRMSICTKCNHPNTLMLLEYNKLEDHLDSVISEKEELETKNKRLNEEVAFLKEQLGQYSGGEMNERNILGSTSQLSATAATFQMPLPSEQQESYMEVDEPSDSKSLCGELNQQLHGPTQDRRGAWGVTDNNESDANANDHRTFHQPTRNNDGFQTTGNANRKQGSLNRSGKGHKSCNPNKKQSDRLFSKKDDNAVSMYQNKHSEMDGKTPEAENWDSHESEDWGDRKSFDDVMEKREQSSERSHSRSRTSSHDSRWTEVTDDRGPHHNNWRTRGRGREVGRGQQKDRRPLSKEQCVVTEKFGDLFTASKENSMAHCVAEDMRMGSGIATSFKRDFKKVDELLSQRKRTGEVAVLADGARYIYYLVTKKVSTGKPTLADLRSSLLEMKKHCMEHEVKAIAMPRIGCGLDRLEWSEVRRILEDIFLSTPVKITVYNFQKDCNEGQGADPKSVFYVKQCLMNLGSIAKDTGLIFCGSEDGVLDETINSLNARFNFYEEYKRSDRKVGHVVKFEKGDYLYGLIIKKKQSDRFSYIDFGNCLKELKKMITKDNYFYMGLEAFLDSDDDLTMEKVITLIKFIFFNVKMEAWICYPEKLCDFLYTYNIRHTSLQSC